MAPSLDPFTLSGNEPTVTFARSIPKDRFVSEYGGQWVLLREVGEDFEVVAHDEDLDASLASDAWREGDISVRIPRPNETRI